MWKVLVALSYRIIPALVFNPLETKREREGRERWTIKQLGRDRGFNVVYELLLASMFHTTCRAYPCHFSVVHSHLILLHDLLEANEYILQFLLLPLATSPSGVEDYARHRLQRIMGKSRASE